MTILFRSFVSLPPPCRLLAVPTGVQGGAEAGRAAMVGNGTPFARAMLSRLDAACFVTRHRTAQAPSPTMRPRRRMPI